jgi:hypothetical protein
MAVTLYRQVGKGKARCYQKVNLGRGRRPADLTGPYFLRYPQRSERPFPRYPFEQLSRAQNPFCSEYCPAG